MKKSIALSIAAMSIVLAGCAVPSASPELIRYPLPNNSTFPIASAVEVRGDVGTVYLSGMVPPNLDPTPGPGRAPNFGADTKIQTEGALKAIDRALVGMGLTMSDVIKMQVFLVGDPAKSGKMDFAGFMEGYTQYFGAAAGQPNLPTRSVFQVAALASPAFLVEIEVVAIRRAPTPAK
jgi:enamine deaminase RidA (YjgF/YER057c/UK114 family)